MKKYQQGGYPLPNFWEAGLESLNFDMYKDAFDARGEYSNAFQNQQNAIQPPAPPKKSIWAKRNERRRGEYVDALKEYNDKKDLATNSFKQSYNMMLPLGMLMQGQQGYMDYLSKPKENLQEEQGFYGFQQGGNVRNRYGYATRQLGINPVLDSVMVENGAPNISTNPLTTKGNRAYYDIENNRINIGNNSGDYERNILAEIAHAKQYAPSRVDFDKLLAEKKYDKLDKALTAAERVATLQRKEDILTEKNQAPSKYYENSGDSLRYVTPGTVEHDAHSVIEPKIKKNYDYRLQRWLDNTEEGRRSYQQGGSLVNKTGFTPGYASMNNPYNVIPSNQITMQNTPFPVYGIGSSGEKKMMYPGNNYNFKGSSHVTEFPMRYQEGGPPEGQGLQKFKDYQPVEEDLLNIPQHTLMEALTGKRKSPSEILYEDGALDKNKLSHRAYATAIDLGLDPLNFIMGPLKYGMKGDVLGLTNTGKIIKTALNGDNIRDLYKGLFNGNSDPNNYKKVDYQNNKKTKIENKQEGGEVSQEPIPLQAEIGEWFSTPDMMLAKVKAKESHKKQDKDNVSDILQPGSFIYSDDKKLIIDKNKKVKGIDLEEITFGRGPIEYSETEQTPLPKEIKFIDIMNKNKMTPAQIAAQVYAKYPSTDREKDAFSIVANEENKSSRMPYLLVLQELNKRKQTKQPQKFQYGGYVQHFQEGGSADGYGYAQTPSGFTTPEVGENPTSTFSVPINQDNIRANGSKLELSTKGDPYVYMINADGTAKTKKKGATNWITMNENQTAALNKQIEAGIFDANYKPKNVKPAATVRTKQDLNKHEEKVSIYTKPGFAFNVDLNHKVENINGQYNNTPYVNYIPDSQLSQISNQASNPSNGYQFQVSDNQNTSNNMQTYSDPTITQMFSQYNIPYSIATGNALGRGISGLVGNAALGVGRGAGIARIAGTTGTEGWTIIPSQGLLGQGAGAAIEGGLGRSLLGQGSQQALNIGRRIPQLAATVYQQGGMLKPMGMLNPIYNQPTNNAITGLGYKDPMEQRDKAFRNQGMYSSNLYAQPTTINKQMFNFEQGGYIPHYQQGGNSNQPTNNTKTGGAGGAAGPIGGIIGAVTDIVGMIAGNVRNDKNLKKARKMLEEDRLEQLRTNSTSTGIRTAGNMMNYASQDPAYTFKDYKNQFAVGDTGYHDIGINLDNAQLAAQNQAMSGASGFMRNSGANGLSPYQNAAFAAAMQANAINANNQTALNYAAQRGANLQNQMNYRANLYGQQADDIQLGEASIRGNLNKLGSNMISGQTNIGVDNINNAQAINSGYRANMMGLNNQAYTRFINNNAMMGNSIKNGFNSGQELYLNQQQQNLQNRNNYQNDPYGNYYGFSGSNPYGQFPYDSGSANYQGPNMGNDQYMNPNYNPERIG